MRAHCIIHCKRNRTIKRVINVTFCCNIYCNMIQAESTTLLNGNAVAEDAAFKQLAMILHKFRNALRLYVVKSYLRKLADINEIHSSSDMIGAGSCCNLKKSIKKERKRDVTSMKSYGHHQCEKS